MQKIRKGDKVVVLTGKDKGRTGEVLRVMPKDDKAVVRGINIVRRHQKPVPVPGRRHHFQGSADPPVEHRDCRPQGWQGRPASVSKSRTARRCALPSAREQYRNG
jgi:hypothetical protein